MIGPQDLQSLPLFDGMSESQLNALLGVGEEIRFEPGQDVWRHGEPADHWWVLLEGALQLLRRSGRDEAVVGAFDTPGWWAGGFRAWDEHGVYLATGRATTAGRMLRVPAAALADLVAEYPLIPHIIDGLFHTARDVEAGARQRDALVTLGRLSAGLAHEINNPAAAATRSVDALGAACTSLLSALGRLADGQVSAEQFSALDRLRLELSPSATAPDPVALADQEESVVAWLDSHGVEQGWRLAPTIAAAGGDVTWCSRLADALPGEALGPAMDWVTSTVDAATLLDEVKLATDRISQIVAAVKSYSQMDRATLQRVQVTDGLESTLVMFGHRCRGSIAVVRDYAAELPAIDASAGELNQVWTNLIDNALDAMGGAGTLTITARADGDHVVVEISDTGPGIPPEVAARAFDAFFTTKDVGEGTGLGLDIARRIVVERHSGEITITSPTIAGDQPAGTRIAVRLPVRPNP